MDLIKKELVGGGLHAVHSCSTQSFMKPMLSPNVYLIVELVYAVNVPE